MKKSELTFLFRINIIIEEKDIVYLISSSSFIIVPIYINKDSHVCSTQIKTFLFHH